MNDDLMDLYQELILDHNRRPRNRRRLEAPSCEAEGFNPLCGDRVSIFVDVENDMVKDVSFEGSGCAIRGRCNREGMMPTVEKLVRPVNQF